MPHPAPCHPRLVVNTPTLTNSFIPSLCFTLIQFYVQTLGHWATGKIHVGRCGEGEGEEERGRRRGGGGEGGGAGSRELGGREQWGGGSRGGFRTCNTDQALPPHLLYPPFVRHFLTSHIKFRRFCNALLTAPPPPACALPSPGGPSLPHSSSSLPGSPFSPLSCPPGASGWCGSCCPTPRTGCCTCRCGGGQGGRLYMCGVDEGGGDVW